MLSHLRGTKFSLQTPVQEGDPQPRIQDQGPKNMSDHGNDAATKTSDATPASKASRSEHDSSNDLRKLIYNTLADNMFIGNVTEDSDLLCVDLTRCKYLVY